jgi:hypothetical protein
MIPETPPYTKSRSLTSDVIPKWARPPGELVAAFFICTSTPTPSVSNRSLIWTPVNRKHTGTLMVPHVGVDD